MRVAMRVPTLRRELPKDPFDLEMLGEFLMSDRARGSMLLSELDGFLTGIAIGPEVLRPSEWLPLIWGGEEPVFDDLDEANAIFGAITWRYNEILHEIADDAPGPIFWSDGDEAIALDWAEGFLQAVRLRLKAWQPLFASKRDRLFLFLILALCADENGKSLLGLSPEADDRILEAAPTLIPSCVRASPPFGAVEDRRKSRYPSRSTPAIRRTTQPKSVAMTLVRAVPAKNSRSAADQAPERSDMSAGFVTYRRTSPRIPHGFGHEEKEDQGMQSLGKAADSGLEDQRYG
jgi:uncharacterized protein